MLLKSIKYLVISCKLPLMEVEKATKEDKIWFNGILDKHTREVISVNMGRIPEGQKEIRIANNIANNSS